MLCNSGAPCDSKGEPLPQKPVATKPSHPPFRTEPPASAPESPWAPSADKVAFDLAHFLFSEAQMSGKKINTLLEIWATDKAKDGGRVPFYDSSDVYKTIDASVLGEVNWETFNIKYDGPRPEDNTPEWMSAEYEVCFRDPLKVARNMLANPDFKEEIDYCAKRDFLDGTRRLKDFMSGDWAWSQSSKIAKDLGTHGLAFVPVILGSDKTTVSIATGDNEYYPLYMMLGNHHNNVRRAHRSAVAVIGFLAILKTDRQHKDSVKFRKFRRQLFHASLARILQTLKPVMTNPEVTMCADGQFRRAVYGLGPYIADYPEQALLACIVQGWCAKCTAPSGDLERNCISIRRWCEHTEALVEALDLGTLWDEYGIVGDIVPFMNDFPRADIHELITPDILHQLIKGTFKDHLVDWVVELLSLQHGSTRGEAVLAEIDRRIAAVPPFTGLRRFPQGRGFKQWTGDDSKALMKVYLPAIDGLVPSDVVRTIRAFLEFCYLVRRNVQTPETLKQLEEAMERFHDYRIVFQETGVRVEGFSLPRQHSLRHYHDATFEFGALNGLCSSITESKHIKAVKEPWRCSSRFKALGQMLKTNLQLDKLAATRVDFISRGIIDKTHPCKCASCAKNPIKFHLILIAKRRPCKPEDDGAVSGPRRPPHIKLASRSSIGSDPVSECQHEYHPTGIYDELDNSTFNGLLRQFIRDQLNSEMPSLHLTKLPEFTDPIYVHYSAAATFYAPSDPSGIQGMRKEHIRATPSWRGGPPCFDCVLVKSGVQSEDSPHPPYDIARVFMFFSFTFCDIQYQCALVHWYEWLEDHPDEDTGMWVVGRRGGKAALTIIPLQRILQAIHLIPMFGTHHVTRTLTAAKSLDEYCIFYVNKYADHHAFELLHSRSS
ncbi:hypothetical protein NEOLEDRAFT_1077191 [Neolentinus lepideus HHB14362 ss-1]|uniref:CxC2-like cysteine cluster KDZ transposase-associated domain-containing protein n=1 Tax=Neolentinus lepideus HHB14362 ss-1 TaxID=1314782 RepID=A0A165NKM4_9AGAM|nr:hypothetical protein NEOLEDRAFT_1077191 [Neolentinus lepideus HHB14362 ss-1]